MSLKINREIFDRVKTAIAETGRINMLSWAESQDTGAAESVGEIRMLPLFSDCRNSFATYARRSAGLATSLRPYLSSDLLTLPDFVGAIWLAVDERRDLRTNL